MLRLMHAASVVCSKPQYLSISQHCRSSVDHAAWPDATITPLEVNLPMTLCQPTLEQRIAAPLHTIHVHSVSDSTYLLCNLVFLASQCNSQRHAFELLCARSALVSIKRMKPCCTANPGFVAYFKYWQGLFARRDGETSGLFAVKIYNDLHV